MLQRKGWLAVFFAVIGCSPPHIQSYVVYEDPTSFVRLEFAPNVQYEYPETWNDHPFVITAETMETMLGDLRVQEFRSPLIAPLLNWLLGPPPTTPAFRKKEIALLAPQIVESLAIAVPEEIVTFYLSTPINSVTREVTSGGLYVSKGNLHFILSNHQNVYGIPAFGLVYDRRNPTFSLAPRGFNLTFSKPDLVVPSSSNLSDRLFGQVSDDEIVINLQKILASTT